MLRSCHIERLAASLVVLGLGIAACTRSVNAPPVADAGPDSIVRVGTAVTLDGTGSDDPDGDTLDFAWTLSSTPAGSGATLSGAATATPTLTPDVAGVYLVALSVSDGAVSDGDSVSVTASDHNLAPVLSAIDDATTSMGTPIDVPLTLADEDPDGVVVEATSDDVSLVPDSGIEARGTGRNRTLHITPATFGVGTVRITVVVRDADALEDDGSFELNLAPPFATQLPKLAPRTRGAGDNVGNALALDGDTAIVGAFKDSDNGAGAGAAYVYARVGDGWTEAAKLLASDGAAGDRFGRSVAIDGDYVVVGAPNNGKHGDEAGAAYVFFHGSDGWHQIARLPPTGPVVAAATSRPSALDHFGWSVAISGSHILVGAPGDDDVGSGAGAAYLYQRCAPRMVCDGPYYEVTKLRPDSDAGVGGFGSAVAVEGTEALIGTPYAGKGAIYAFHAGADTWDAFDVVSSPGSGSVAYFGAALAMRGSHAVVGAPLDRAGGIDAGAAYALAPSNGVWHVTGELSDGTAGTEFANLGASVAIGDLVSVVGVPRAGAAGSETGSVDVFQRSGDAWAYVNRLTARDEADGDAFGYAVAVDGSYVMVGAPLDDDGGKDSGSVYVFRR